MEGLRPQWAVKAIIIIIMASMLFGGVSATNHTVGGASGWDLTSNIQDWASETTFRVGDFLVFSYTPVHDVLEVEAVDYRSCDISEPISTYNEGETMIPLTEEGTRYFICGRQGHCSMGMKLEAQVQASSANENNTPRRRNRPSRSPPPPPPSPHDDDNHGGIEIQPPNAPGPTSASPHNKIIMPLVTTLPPMLVLVMINILFSDWSILGLHFLAISHLMIA